jgi:hypothetical protein
MVTGDNLPIRAELVPFNKKNYRDFGKKVEMCDLENKPNKRPDNRASYWWVLNYSGSDPILGTGVINGRLLTLYFILYSYNQESIAAPPLELHAFVSVKLEG